MSRVGKQPIRVPEKVEVRLEGGAIRAKGPLGELSHPIPSRVQVEISDGQILVRRSDDDPRSQAFHGLTRALIANMVHGVAEGFSRVLEIQGIGYRAERRGKGLRFHLGFAQPIDMDLPEGIEVEIEGGTILTVRGADKQLVGQVASDIRALRPPDPYKGKGIRYQGQHIRRKAGKTAATGIAGGP